MTFSTTGSLKLIPFRSKWNPLIPRKLNHVRSQWLLSANYNVSRVNILLQKWIVLVYKLLDEVNITEKVGDYEHCA